MRRIDALLVLMVVIWGANYSLIKHAFQEIPPQPFNALRLTIASSVFLVAIRIAGRRARAKTGSTVFFTPSAVSSREVWQLVWLGFIGHFVYQYCFVGGVDQTSVSNAALIIGATPVAVAVISALMGREKIGALHWLGAAVSLTGLWFIVGRGADFGSRTFHGDLLVMTSVACWVFYTLGASRLIARHSPLFVTGITMAIGGIPYVAATLPQIVDMDWRLVSFWTWVSLVISALFALNVAYLIWYTGVQKIGAARTSMYSNLVPIVAMAVAAAWLGEPLGWTKILGALAVLSGVFLTRLGRKPTAVPIEE
jgi:drug/metabolite transporter (DMT)-like permease